VPFASGWHTAPSPSSALRARHQSDPAGSGQDRRAGLSRLG
jgi:hypothetical protein